MPYLRKYWLLVVVIGGFLFGLLDRANGDSLFANEKCGPDTTNCAAACTNWYKGKWECAEFVAIQHKICVPVLPRDFTYACDEGMANCAAVFEYTGQICDPATGCMPDGRLIQIEPLFEVGCSKTVIFV